MKKIYSFVLMAMMLLVGTNAWANYPAGWLQQQFDNIQADGQTHTIVMGEDIILTDPVYLGTATEDAPRKSIILDMHGHNITMNATTWLENPNHSGVFCSVFNITHGELLIRNEDKSNTSLIQMIGVASGNYNNIFNVVGSYRSNRWVKNGNQYDTIPVDKTQLTHAKNTRDADGGWFTHLEIGDGVKLYAANEVYGSGISIDGYYMNTRGLISSSDQVNQESIFPNSALSPDARNTCLFEREDAPQYNTSILKGGYSGVAYGVRVDVYGDIEFATGATDGKSYGIKLNGGLRSSLRSDEVFHNQNLWYIDEAYARTYGATAAPTTKDTKTFTISEEVYQNHRNDTVDAPFVYIHKTAHIIAASTLNEATAVYCSGYGKTLIEGACSGNSGVNVKSGTVELHDAEITCTATAKSVYVAVNGNNATGTGAVVVNSVDERAGGIEVIISGDSKVSTDYGYAIKETVTATDNKTKVSSISIEGGTIQGGAATETSGGGAIIVSEETKKEVVIYGANLTGNNGVEVGGGTLTDLLPKNEQTQDPEGHVTPVLDPVTSKTTLVISAGAGPATQEGDDPTPWSWCAADAQTLKDVAWEAKEDASIESGTIRLGELTINSGSGTAQGERQKLTIKDGAVLQVKNLIMNSYAQIIVEAGGKLIVEGKQGINAPSVDNIILESSEAKQATFLFNPEVSSNKYPKATVDMTVAKGVDEDGDVWTRFAIPVRHMPTTGWIKKNNATTWLYGWDYEANEGKGAWATVTNGSLTGSKAMKPWTGYTLSNNLQSAEVYTFKDSLVGNVNAELKFVHEGYNYFGNSYSSYIDAKTLLQGLTDSHVDGAVYMWSVANQAYTSTSLYALNKPDIDDWQKDVAPMQTFILKLRGADKATQSVNYDAAVWSNPRYGHSVVSANNAPRRQMAESNDDAYINMVVTAANGKSDRILFFENAANSDAYENGYDASKYMNENTINFYATVNGENLSNVVTDNLEGKLVTLQTNEDVTYTISFKTVEGNEYVLRDNVTGAEVAIFAGNTYEFAAQPNSVIEGRFEIIKAAKMPTAIENTEVKANVKGIYTLTGQYLGEDFSVLPAGVYVVNGVKIVK